MAKRHVYWKERGYKEVFLSVLVVFQSHSMELARISMIQKKGVEKKQLVKKL